MDRTYPVHAVLRAPAVHVALEDGVLMRAQFALLVVDEPALVPLVLALPLDTRARRRHGVARPEAVAPVQIIVVRFRYALPMPHQVRIVELDRRRGLVVDLVDDVYRRRVWLIVGCIRVDLRLEHEHLHIPREPRPQTERVDAVVQFVRDVLRELREGGELLCDPLAVVLPGNRLEACVHERLDERVAGGARDAAL